MTNTGAEQYLSIIRVTRVKQKCCQVPGKEEADQQTPDRSNKFPEGLGAIRIGYTHACAPDSRLVGSPKPYSTERW